MDVSERRVANLKLLLLSTTAAELARKSGVAASYISRALLEPGEPNHKRIGEITARKLERGARKPEFWLDLPPATQPSTVRETGAQYVASAALPEDMQSLLQDMLDAMLDPILAQKLDALRAEVAARRDFAAALELRKAEKREDAPEPSGAPPKPIQTGLITARQISSPLSKTPAAKRRAG